MSHNKFYGIDDSNFEQIESSLEAIHEIDRVIGGVSSIARSLDAVGIGCSEELMHMVNHLRSLAKNVEDGIMRESHDRYHQTRETTNQIIGMALTSCLVKEVK
jgi:hypothetical protein